jgi:ABC-type Fe3+/spermidine/putrescine transport system ATPase subunit
LMDEPLSALDKPLREAMQIELRRLHRELGPPRSMSRMTSARRLRSPIALL